MFFIINSRLQSVHASRANINMFNFVISFILPYSISREERRERERELRSSKGPE